MVFQIKTWALGIQHMQRCHLRLNLQDNSEPLLLPTNNIMIMVVLLKKVLMKVIIVLSSDMKGKI